MMSIRTYVRSIVRLIPAFAAVSILGLVVALLLKVPADSAGIIVGVPMVYLFVFNRIAVLLTPRKVSIRSEERPQRIDVRVDHKAQRFSVLFRLGFYAFVFGMIAFAVLLPSSLSYLGLGLAKYGGRTFIFAVVSLFTAVIGLSVVVIEESLNKHEGDALLRVSVRQLVHTFWKLMRAPTHLAWFFFGSFGDPIHRYKF